MKRRWYVAVGVFCLITTLVPFASRCSASGGQGPAPPAGAKTVCTLSDEQETAAPKAFAVMTPTFQHPRCLNCHGVVNPYTGANHGGGPIKPTLVKAWVEHIDNGLEPSHDVNHPAFKLYTCGECHVDSAPTNEQGTGWRLPPRFAFFVGKDSIQICKQMKQTLGTAEQFMDHISRDATVETHFIEISFLGTRGLNQDGQDFYEGDTQKKFVPEPPLISHSTFTSQAQGWVEAMDGKFRGDECGCVPHHYSLSIDTESNQDFNVGGVASHTATTSHADIPLKFKDDDSFEADAQVTMTTTGYEHGIKSVHTGQPEDCTITGTIVTKFKLSGTVDEAGAVLHLVSSKGTFGGSSTATCSDGTAGTTAMPTVATPGMTWEIPSLVGVDHAVPMPGQQPPHFASSMKVRINQTD